MTAQKFNPQKLEQLIALATSPRERKMYQSLLKKALIEEQKAQVTNDLKSGGLKATYFREESH